MRRHLSQLLQLVAAATLALSLTAAPVGAELSRLFAEPQAKCCCGNARVAHHHHSTSGENLHRCGVETKLAVRIAVPTATTVRPFVVPPPPAAGVDLISIVTSLHSRVLPVPAAPS